MGLVVVSRDVGAMQVTEFFTTQSCKCSIIKGNEGILSSEMLEGF